MVFLVPGCRLLLQESLRKVDVLVADDLVHDVFDLVVQLEDELLEVDDLGLLLLVVELEVGLVVLLEELGVEVLDLGVALLEIVDVLGEELEELAEVEVAVGNVEHEVVVLVLDGGQQVDDQDLAGLLVELLALEVLFDQRLAEQPCPEVEVLALLEVLEVVDDQREGVARDD